MPESFIARRRQDNAVAALAALLVVCGLVVALVLGLRARGAGGGVPSLAAILMPPEVKPPPPPLPPTRSRARRGRAAVRPAGRAAAAPAPPLPQIVLAPALPLPPIPRPAMGALTLTLPLAGTGAGAAGKGLGGGGTGGSGSGSGGGAGTGGVATGAVQVSGKLTAHDLPHDVLPPGGSLAVGVAYTVGVDGRVRDCSVTASSGFAEVDVLVCRLLEQRFRYRPARDAAGHAVASPVRETHAWARRPDRRAERANPGTAAACADPMLC